ncbi:hypothetical protein LPJ63_000109 [Coemansia sp. RSA 2711]|nr:hypothetical protein LPJ63_000109 [Coemansia sp. RSA 2711]
MADWTAASTIIESARLAKGSAGTEETIALLSDTSGRLFSDPFAPWHRRDGVSYAEYLQQLKIVRASDSQTQL